VSDTLTFSRQAKETYAAIQSQLYNRWGQTVLEKFERKTVKTLDLILQSPLMFKSITDNPNIRKGLIHKIVLFFIKLNRLKQKCYSFGTTGKTLSFYKKF